MSGSWDAKFVLLAVGVVGDLLQGGLIFGWNALALVLRQQGNFGDHCPTPQPGGDQVCKPQESRLALMYTVGVFAVNFGPVLVGPVLDRLGPRITSCAGCSLSALGLLLFGISNSHSVNAFIPAAVLVGLGGVGFHLAQFNMSVLFPAHRGMVSGCFVGGFVGSGIIFLALQGIINALGGSRAAYRGAMLVYAGVVAAWVPLCCWVEPRKALRLGQVYRFERASWRFQPCAVADSAKTLRDVGSVCKIEGDESCHAGEASQHRGAHGVSTDGLHLRAKSASLDSLEHGPTANGTVTSSSAGNIQPALYGGQEIVCLGNGNDSAQCREALSHEAAGAAEGSASADGGSNSQTWHGNAVDATSNAGNADGTAAADKASAKPAAVMVRESQRFGELRLQTFWRQIRSPEAIGMTIFFTLNVLVLQFYLGTARLQLLRKGDTHHTYAKLINVVVSLGFLAIPLQGWLLDSKGYAITLAVINVLGVACALLQVVPDLGVQILTFILWAACRGTLYSSFYAIIGNLFGFKSFGRIIGVSNGITGLVGLLILPLTNFALGPLHSRFWILNVASAVLLLPLFGFCAVMWRWERRGVVENTFTGNAEVDARQVGS